MEPEIQEKPDAVDIGRARGDIALENVTFEYTDRPPAVKDVTFAAPRPERGSRSSARPEPERRRS